MMNHISVDDIYPDECQYIRSRLIPRPLKKKKQKGWTAYRNSYIRQNEHWVILLPMDFPYKRNTLIDKDINHASTIIENQFSR
jgi:hypothetical protein